jgi:hypothetical protein
MTAGSGGEDWAKVLLPSTMSDLQLEQLLAVCPSFDAEQEDENIEAMRSWDASSNELPSGYRAQPSIGFVDPNSGTSASSAPTGVASVLPIGKTEATSEETARLERLKTILNKEHDDYYSGLMGG